ncbi:molybdenum ABC transporter ATP-binding protein [Brachybacterium ginsengisoli]|uniref:Molybdenum ABC transporter ATP-binding protein n=1 Tax=Brachybacterium ginsengisoli TaxID=1331682 RepID=A0A291GX24_9MICO|nr:ABC transporter ATP-binding protein [Brachybacterium ginsengisoli]ATG54644.1 molybdenum ABC transporter ATP-binding protein [Brachybacterium ginsengisoli]
MSLDLRASVPERGVALNLSVPDGETLALIGPNGAGKSTTLSLIAGALRPGRGSIELDGRVLDDERVHVPVHDREVTTLGQDPALFPHLTALDNVAFGLRSRGATRREARHRAARWLEELDLSGLADRRPAQLSGGEAQRVAIARALAAAPRLLLLDEPLAALDVEVAPALREQLRRFLAGRTAVIVTHDVLDALTLADSVAVLEAGSVLEQGPTAEVLARPRTAFAARFAGLNLVTGAWDGQAVHLADGSRLPAPGSFPAGTSVHAAFRPSAVRLLEEGGLRRTVENLSPGGDLVRVGTEDIAADLPPQEIAERRLTPGVTVQLAVPAEAVTTYRA